VDFTPSCFTLGKDCRFAVNRKRGGLWLQPERSEGGENMLRCKVREEERKGIKYTKEAVDYITDLTIMLYEFFKSVNLSGNTKVSAFSEIPCEARCRGCILVTTDTVSDHCDPTNTYY
jgi:hypothetical protein